MCNVVTLLKNVNFKYYKKIEHLSLSVRKVKRKDLEIRMIIII